jgi:uncharacterized protein (DUF1501 family)
MNRPIDPRRCPGTFSRRAFLRASLTGLGTLSLGDLLRLQAQAGQGKANQKSLILLWLWGGPSHMETFDLKPEAPSDYRGEFKPIRTNVPGLQISEQLPRLARLADKFALVRSLHHDSPGHVNSEHTLMTGYPGELVEVPPYRPKYPDFRAVTYKVLGERRSGVPVHVVLPRVHGFGPAYLGASANPLTVTGDPGAGDFKLPSLSLSAASRPRFQERLDLLHQFDDLRRDLDTSGTMASLETYNQKAVDLLTRDATARAFDLNEEDPRLRDRYGRHEIGQRCLLARRLVEAGVRLVTVDFPCVPGQKAFSWDDHASVWNIFEQMKIRLPVLDQVVSALIEDLSQRGLWDDVLLVVMGEMSHTPKLSNFNGQPGREHWARSMSAFLSSGGLIMGQAIGSTNHKGEEPRDNPVTPNDLLATLYHYLGVPADTTFTDPTGRPVPVLPSGRAIKELVG